MLHVVHIIFRLKENTLLEFYTKFDACSTRRNHVGARLVQQ